MLVYKLFWDEFSSWYLEMVKPAYGQPIDRKTYEATLHLFDVLLRLLHPFMPFITEELWQHLADRKPGESIMMAPVEQFKDYGCEGGSGALQDFRSAEGGDCGYPYHPSAEEYCAEGGS